MLEATAQLSELVAKQVNSGRSPHGCQCIFVKIDDKWGIKTYHSSQMRDKAVERQSLIHKAGYAPSVGQSFNIGENLFCYVTELAIPLVDSTVENLNGDWYALQDDLNKQNPDLKNMVRTLVEKVTEAGYSELRMDQHYGNMGMLGDKLVCIDFT